MKKGSNIYLTIYNCKHDFSFQFRAMIKNKYFISSNVTHHIVPENFIHKIIFPQKIENSITSQQLTINFYYRKTSQKKKTKQTFIDSAQIERPRVTDRL